LAQHYGFSLPKVYNFNSIEDILVQTGQPATNQEGWVVEFSDGQRFKFKMDDYVEIHKLLRGLDFPNVLKAVANGDIKRVLEMVPDVFPENAKRWVEEIQVAVADLKAQTFTAFTTAPKESREVFSKWAETYHPTLSPYLWAMFDGQPLEPVIYRHAFKDVSEMG
jgi:hypothetical protein